jgi:hypothetical protein
MWRHEAQRPSWPTDPTHKTNIPPHSQTLAVGASHSILSRSRNHMVRVALPTSVGGHHPRPAGGHHPCPAGHHLDASLLPRWPPHPLPLPPPLSPPPLFSLPSWLLGGTCGRWWGSFESDDATDQVSSATRWSLLPLWHPAQRPLPPPLVALFCASALHNHPRARVSTVNHLLRPEICRRPPPSRRGICRCHPTAVLWAGTAQMAHLVVVGPSYRPGTKNSLRASAGP